MIGGMVRMRGEKMVIKSPSNFGVRLSALTFVLFAAAVSTASVGQGTFLTPAVSQSHCAARFSFEASRAKQRSDAASFQSLSRRAMELARERKFGNETDEQLALYAKNFEIFLRDKAASNPELEAAFGQAVEQCKTGLEKGAN